MNDMIHIGNADILVKEYKGQRVVTFKDIDTVHGRPEGTAKRNFRENKSRFIESEDYFRVCADEIRTNKIMDISDKVHQDIVFLTEQGYLMLVKSFTDDLAWDVQRQLVNGYFRVRQIVDERLSPETKMLFQMINQIAATELQAKEAKELAQKAIETTEAIKDAVQPVLDNWRTDINRKFNRIQGSTGIPFKDLRTEMYKALEERAGCDLNIRIRNKRERMAESGCTQTEIKQLNKMDIIEADKKLREIFSKIVTEYEIRYCA